MKPMPLSILTILVVVVNASGCGSGDTGAQAPPTGAETAAAIPAADTADAPAAEAEPSQGAARTVEEIERERAALDEQVWADEVRAQHYEQTIVKYWDRMTGRSTDEKFAALASFPMESIAVGSEQEEAKELPWDIKRYNLAGEPKQLSPAEWKELLTSLKEEGYQIVSEEWHQSSFDYTSPNNASSKFSMTLYITDKTGNTRWQLKGDMGVAWSDVKDEQGLYLAKSVDVSKLEILERTGPKAFDVAATFFAGAGERPILCYDLDHDGDSEVVVPVEQKIYWNQGDWKFDEQNLFGDAVRIPLAITASCIADFTNDGHADFLCSGTVNMDDQYPSLVLFPGGAEGTFEQNGTVIHADPLELRYASVITAGDIDGDGDLDCWVGQYLNPYTSGKPPTPFHDANDGNPAYLLVNEGGGKFRESTEEAGLGPKRWRRTYAASFADLDYDHDLDLLTVNDYAGVDVYYNNGSGKFEDVTKTAVDEAANFGMAHTFADFNRDGRSDFYVTGMSSTTMRRLTHMGLSREDFPEFADLRWKMGYGNRMYLNDEPGTYKQPPFNDQVARTGWTWGTTALDFDSDSNTDVYVANGHITGKSAKDYCTRFWCHDIYVKAEKPDPTLAKFFDKTLLGDLGDEMSWDGFQHNNLLMNLDGAGFVNVAFMMDVDFVFDARSALSDDFDQDGKPDLVVTKLTPEGSEALLVRNRLLEENNWIGIRLREAPGAPHPMGATIQLAAGSLRQASQIVTGDSYRAQHALMKNFGLGKADAVEFIEVTWPNGATARLDNPAINQYHLIQAVQDKATLAEVAEPSN